MTTMVSIQLPPGAAPNWWTAIYAATIGGASIGVANTSSTSSIAVRIDAVAALTDPPNAGFVPVLPGHNEAFSGLALGDIVVARSLGDAPVNITVWSSGMPILGPGAANVECAPPALDTMADIPARD